MRVSAGLLLQHMTLVPSGLASETNGLVGYLNVLAAGHKILSNKYFEYFLQSRRYKPQTASPDSKSYYRLYSDSGYIPDENGRLPLRELREVSVQIQYIGSALYIMHTWLYMLLLSLFMIYFSYHRF